MRVLVMGPGGVGGYYGGVLSKSGHDVTLVARGEHLEAIARDGLRVESLSAVMAGVKEIRAAIERARRLRDHEGATALFLDEPRLRNRVCV